VVKYAGQTEFVPITMESHGPINSDTIQLLSELGRWLVETTGGCSSILRFRSKCISVVVQR